MKKKESMTKKEIALIIKEAFRVSPEDKAAYELHSRGMTEMELWKIFKEGKAVGYVSILSLSKVINALRDIERRKRHDVYK